MGVSLVIIHFSIGFSLTKTIQLFGVFPHDELDPPTWLLWIGMPQMATAPACTGVARLRLRTMFCTSGTCDDGLNRVINRVIPGVIVIVILALQRMTVNR